MPGLLRAARQPGRAARSADEAEQALVSALWRALDSFRVLAVLYAAWLAWNRHDLMVRPRVALVVVLVLAAWTIGRLVCRRPGRVLLGAELALACAGVLATIWCESPSARGGGVGTVQRCGLPHRSWAGRSSPG